jgi:hypothetical protein
MEFSMPTKSGWEQAPTKQELGGFARKQDAGVVTSTPGVDDDTVRYAKGVIIPDDDDCHLSDHAHFKSSNVADPGEAVAGLQVVKK